MSYLCTYHEDNFGHSCLGCDAAEQEAENARIVTGWRRECARVEAERDAAREALMMTWRNKDPDSASCGFCGGEWNAHVSTEVEDVGIDEPCPVGAGMGLKSAQRGERRGPTLNGRPINKSPGTE